MLLFSVPFQLRAQSRKEVSATVKEVTVFLQRAQVFSSVRTNISAGETEVAIINVPSQLDAASLQVEAKGNAMLLNIRYENDYLGGKTKPKDVIQVEDSLQNYTNQIRTVTDQIDIFRKEETMILANQSIGGQKGVTLDDLEEIADFFRQRLTSIRTNILKNEIKLKILNEKAQNLRNQLGEVNSRRALPTGRILVNVSAENATPLNLEISYVVYNAGWQPTYDLRATNTKSPMKLFYKANVYQNTGVSWNNVNLTLATTNPSIGATKPELQPWYLYFYTPTPRVTTLSEVSVTSASRKRNRLAKPAVNQSIDVSAAPPAEMEGWGAEAADVVSDYTQTTESTLSVNFKIGIPYSVPSDGKRQLVDIQQLDVPATYKYAATPKLSTDAFLLAQLTGWDEYNILPGEANIFLEGTFTGKTVLNPQATGDTLQVSLGRDKRVVISREKVKELQSKSLLGNTRKEVRGFVTTIRNTKNEALEITLEDQIPVSNNKEIEVELEEGSNGNLNKDTGKITWNLKLNPNETKKIPLRFSVKYPKNQVVPGL
ncbi:DUF4139 domain-containing protein [Adhaeribacter terrigena]|uniref:DUF4139 domain-containing protein n=1 Tax=Adhaeribacter terrigena TaxID=2793070 RepID=UPI00190D5890|nr:DUF4139 domain-containing protein [Adhaeribacter terrigena]